MWCRVGDFGFAGFVVQGTSRNLNMILARIGAASLLLLLLLFIIITTVIITVIIVTNILLLITIYSHMCILCAWSIGRSLGIVSWAQNEEGLEFNPHNAEGLRMHPLRIDIFDPDSRLLHDREVIVHF